MTEANKGEAVAIVRAIDHNKRMSILELDKPMYEKLKSDADSAGLSLEKMALIHMTNNLTSRFKGSISIIDADRQ